MSYGINCVPGSMKTTTVRYDMEIIKKDPCIANKARGLYWCNAKDPKCSKSFCYIYGGGCFCTHNPLFKAPFYEVLNSENRVNQYNHWNTNQTNQKIFAKKDTGIIIPKK